VSRAIRIHEAGGPEVMRLEEIELGRPGPGQVRLRNTAVAVNYRDVCIRSGIHKLESFPSGVGIESAGIVEAIGADVSGISPGDRVACVAGPDGAYADARIVPAARVVVLPDGIDERTAAAMMIRGMTARYLIHDTHRLQAGETILLHAAAGGVGMILSQWANHLGATVIGTVGTDEKAAAARRNGCDHVIVYSREDFVERVRAITGGKGVDVVYDAVGKATFEGSLQCLQRRGLMVSFGEASGHPGPVAPARLGHLGSLYLTHPSLPDYTSTRAELLATANDLFAMVLGGHIRIDTQKAYPLSEAVQAHRDFEGRQTIGSIILIP
jgi:NADPH2:quinone reductase